MKILKVKDLIFDVICIVLILFFGSIALRNWVFYEKYPVSTVPVEQYPLYSGKEVYEYHRSTLKGDDQVIYDSLKEAMLQYHDQVTLSVDKPKAENVKKIFQMVTQDHPEIFWVHGIVATNNMVTGTITNKTVGFDYSITLKEAKEIKEKIEPKIQSIVDEAKNKKSDYDKIKFVHDKLITIGNYNAGYASDVEYRYQSIIEIFDSGNTVCAGFSEGFKLIMDRLGIDAIEFKSINNENEDLSHIWNMVYVNNEWKNIDITYDNQYSDGDTIKYTYFLIDNPHFYINHEMPENLPR